MHRHPLGLLAAAGILLFGALCLAPQTIRPLARAESRYGVLLHETRSDYSHIRVREKDGVRSLLFVDEDGTEQRQSALALDHPGKNQLGYTESLFTSMLYRHPQDRVLIVGLGGGGMLRFLNHSFPAMMVEAVEIDPVVVRLAAEYFETVPGPRTRLHTRDAFAFFREEPDRYDAIYMDAFLRPAPDSGLEEKTTRLKTVAFLKTVRSRLEPGGVVAFNLIEARPGTADDLAAIRAVFPAMALFDVPGSGNLVVIASDEAPAPDAEELLRRARRLDATLEVELSFETLAARMRPAK
ncbi:MAG: fused MFS/spermidine synthase [Verrucomicrobiaceae bacterium]|nr:fused MFS/spermidine synthase [Verrucomicrobiaceae bacterium]